MQEVKDKNNYGIMVMTREGNLYMTPLEIYNRVIEDSEKSNFNWLFSAPELLRVTSLKYFPEEYAKEIQIKVLDCFASLAHNVEYAMKESDLEVVNAIYSRFVLTEEEEQDKDKMTCRDNYLRAIIDRAIKFAFEVPVYYGPQYNELEAKWKKSKFEMYQGIYSINFRSLLDVLSKDFKEFITEASEKGLMDADKEYRKEVNEKHIKHFVSMFRINNE